MPFNVDSLLAAAEKSKNQRKKREQSSRSSAPPPPVHHYTPPITSNSSGHYTKPVQPAPVQTGPIQPVKPPPPSINAYLTKDTTYQQQLRSLGKSLADFLAQQKQQNSRINEDYTSANSALNTQKTFDLKNIEDDFASRGLLTSGLYAGEVGDYNTNFLQQLNELTKGKNRSLADLLSQKTQFQSQQQLAQQAAREAAIRRRAEQYGL